MSVIQNLMRAAENVSKIAADFSEGASIGSYQNGVNFGSSVGDAFRASSSVTRSLSQGFDTVEPQPAIQTQPETQSQPTADPAAIIEFERLKLIKELVAQGVSIEDIERLLKA